MSRYEKDKIALSELASNLFSNVPEDWLDRPLIGLGMSPGDYIEKYGANGVETVRTHLLGIHAGVYA